MLAKIHRIDKKKFDSAFSAGRVVANNVLLLRYQKTTHTDLSHFSCIVSKKVSKSSPMRHKLKRRIYNICRAHMVAFPTGYYMFFLKKGCESMTFASLELAALDLIKKIS